jgi:hypothetical protein
MKILMRLQNIWNGKGLMWRVGKQCGTVIKLARSLQTLKIFSRDFNN